MRTTLRSTVRRGRLSTEWSTVDRHVPLDLSSLRHTGVTAGGYFIDLLILLGIPALLIGIYQFPEAVRQDLVFHYGAPTLLTAYVSHFIHFSPAHLLGNLIAYVLLASVAYAIFTIGGHRSLFRRTTLTILLVFPFALSLLNLAIPRYAFGYGFSGVSMAMLGLLPLGLALGIGGASRRNASVSLRLAVSLFLLSVAGISLAILPPGRLVLAIAGSSMIGAAMYGLVSFKTAFSSVSTRDFSVVPTPTRSLLALGFLFWLGFLHIGFPAATVPDDGVINLYVHFLGYALGFLVPYVTLIVQRAHRPAVRDTRHPRRSGPSSTPSTAD